MSLQRVEGGGSRRCDSVHYQRRTVSTEIVGGPETGPVSRAAMFIPPSAAVPNMSWTAALT